MNQSSISNRSLHFALLALICAVTVGPAVAQTSGRRDPSPEEKAAIMKVYDAMNPVIASFLAAHDMELDPSSSVTAAGLSVPAGGVMDAAFIWDSRVKSGSDRYQKRIKPELDKIEALNQAGKADEVKAAQQEMDQWSRFRIEVKLNAEALGYGTAPAKNTVLKVAGASKAFVVAEDDRAPDNQGSRVLAFGNWKGAQPDAENNADRFQFAHPSQTPVVENLVVTVSGAADLIQDFVAKTNWTGLAGPLMP